MTIQRTWEVQLTLAVRMFLDRYAPESQTSEEALADCVELDRRMNGRFHDEWLALRAERDAQRKQDQADHPDPEEKTAEAEARGEAVENR